MRSFFLAIGAMLVGSSLANAGVMGHSRLSLSNIRLVDVNGDDTLDAAFDGGPHSSDVRARQMSTTVTNSANLTGFTSDFSQGGALISSGNGAANFGPNQALDVVVGDINGDYMRSTSQFGGSYFKLVDPDLATNFPVPAFASTYADFKVDTFGLVGDSMSDIKSAASFMFQPNKNFTARLEFDALVDMYLSDGFVPADFYSSAQTSFSVSMTETIANSSATSNNSVFDVAGFANANATNALNNFISIPSSGNPVSIFNKASYVFNEFDLKNGSFYTLTINQTVSVDVGVNPVPEPTSGLAFAVLAGCGIFSRRRRRQNA